MKTISIQEFTNLIAPTYEPPHQPTRICRATSYTSYPTLLHMAHSIIEDAQETQNTLGLETPEDYYLVTARLQVPGRGIQIRIEEDQVIAQAVRVNHQKPAGDLKGYDGVRTRIVLSETPNLNQATDKEATALAVMLRTLPNINF